MPGQETKKSKKVKILCKEVPQNEEIIDVEQLTKAIAMVDVALEIFTQFDPNQDRSEKVCSEIQSTLHTYGLLLSGLKNQ